VGSSSSAHDCGLEVATQSRRESRLTLAAVLGIIGGLLEQMLGFFALLTGGMASDPWTALVGILVIGVGVVGIVGGVKARRKPQVAWRYMIAASVPGLLMIWPGLALLIGGVIAKDWASEKPSDYRPSRRP
jgi:4-amino-4-deoxy-L-arabinose transferase-like glycosyltransferase